MTITLIIRNFTGKTISLDVDPTTNVSNIKDMISGTLLCKNIRPGLAFKGHELRDHRELSYYGITSQATLHILPPSTVPKISLQFEKADGRHFTLEVNSNATVTQLINDLQIEEKEMNVQKLKFVSFLEEPEDPETVLASEPQYLLGDSLISQYPLSNSIIFICGLPPPIMPPPTFNVCVVLYDDGRKLDVEVRLQHTLNDFREAVQLQHNVNVSDDILILVGKEVVGDELPIWDLGFVPDCVVHAVPFVSFDVEIFWVKKFDTMLLHPLTRLSVIRKLLTQHAAPYDISLDQYWFTLDGKELLKEWRTLWDLNVVSGSTLYMRTRVMSVMIQGASITRQLDVEEDDTVQDLMERWALTTGFPITDRQRLIYRSKVLQEGRFLRDEGFVGGETLRLVDGPRIHSSPQSNH